MADDEAEVTDVRKEDDVGENDAGKDNEKQDATNAESVQAQEIESDKQSVKEPEEGNEDIHVEVTSDAKEGN